MKHSIKNIITLLNTNVFDINNSFAFMAIFMFLLIVMLPLTIITMCTAPVNFAIVAIIIAIVEAIELNRTK